MVVLIDYLSFQNKIFTLLLDSLIFYVILLLFNNITPLQSIIDFGLPVEHQLLSQTILMFNKS